MTQKKIAKAWKFESSSGSKLYETLLYSDGSTSCDCPGWTRRSERSCKHTRSVQMGSADNECKNVVTFQALGLKPFALLPKMQVAPLPKGRKNHPPQPAGSFRKLRFNED